MNRSPGLGPNQPADRSGPKLVIDHMLTFQLLRMPEFWTALPVLYDDIRVAEVPEAIDKAVQIAMGKTCVGCTSIRTALTPIHNKLWSRLDAAVAGSGQEVAAAFVTMIVKKRGYRPNPIEVYYKSDDAVMHKLVL